LKTDSGHYRLFRHL